MISITFHSVDHQFVMMLHVPEFTQPLVLTVSVAVGFYINFTPLFLYSLTMLLHVPGFIQSLVLAITVVVISSSITAVFHTSSVIQTCCLLRSSCSPSQIYFQLAPGPRVYFENLFHGRLKLFPIRLPYDDLIQLVSRRQDLQFFGIYYSTSFLYLSCKPPPRSGVVLPDFVPGILVSTAEPLASIQHLATAEHFSIATAE